MERLVSWQKRAASLNMYESSSKHTHVNVLEASPRCQTVFIFQGTMMYDIVKAIEHLKM